MMLRRSNYNDVILCENNIIDDNDYFIRTILPIVIDIVFFILVSILVHNERRIERYRLLPR